MTGLFTPDRPQRRWRITKTRSDGSTELKAIACDEFTAAAWEAVGCDVTEIEPVWPWEVPGE